MYKKLFYLATGLLSFIVLASAVIDDDWLTALLSKLDAVRVKYPQEKVHVQFDKPYYSIGEEMWLKAYVVNSESNELSALSKILYVDLIDDQDSIRKTIALPVINGLSNGDIKLTDSLFSAGNYRVKAYTRYMQNFSDDYVFNKTIIIGDARMNTGIIADAKFTFAPSKLNAEISYIKLSDHAPLMSKPVTYELFYKEKSIASGRAKTDANGKVMLSLSVKEQYKAESVFLQTTIAQTPENLIKKNFPIYDENLKPDVQFFPEGGRLVMGLRSKVGFKATMPNGMGTEIKGAIVDQANKTVTEFTSAHAGMGVFALQPVAGITYTAVITGPTGAENRYPLPAVEAEGYVLGINHLGNDTLSVRMAASKGLVGDKEVALIAQQNGVVKYTTKVKLDQSVINARIPEARFGTGIVQFTLISADAMPLAERLVFVNHHDQLKMNISTAKASYSKREKVQMQLDVKDSEGKPVEGNFSVAITDESKVKGDEDAETSIYSNLLLTSDLKGYIEKPNYYFNSDSDDKVRHLDNLLLTQGWRRFMWSDIKAGTLPALNYAPQQSLVVTGRITSVNNKLPMPGAKVTLYASTPQGMILIDTTADANGKFVFDELEFNDDVKFIVRAKNAKNKNNVRITVDKPMAPVHSGMYNWPDPAIGSSFVSYLQNTQQMLEQLSNGLQGNSIMLKEVKIKEKKKWVDRNAIKGSSRVGAGIPDIVLKKEKLNDYPSLLMAFYGLAGIEVKNNQVYRIGRISSITQPQGQPMLVMLNGMAITPDMLKDIRGSDVEGVEILKSGANTTIYGEEGVWGVIIVTLKSGASGFIYVPPTYVGLVKVSGYAQEREFYSPAYDKPSESDKQPDYRSTIYWQPNIVTNPEGKATVTYYTADAPGTYHVVAEGINIDGKLVRQVFNYTVK